ncbi:MULTISPECIES: hypothetical protein [unclassified Oceanobacter]|jgi:hypothetical protein|uniref:hypothetical protein n=1 Tax=unclassified Oceanobacter TaxID=2620260 RepID=UPI0027337226|nr:MULTISPECIES: hypothetical protein [unclassified Oceanobacter]MDP2507289.1 hypothetical protein [Oceanobacter sp. 3_MG-2023]MDP2548434.1 hypothetical protein [Oceanobacter sp. 4_MG-2023]
MRQASRSVDWIGKLIAPALSQPEEFTMRLKYKNVALAMVTAVMLAACAGPHHGGSGGHSHDGKAHDGKSHSSKDYKEDHR